MKEKRSVCYLIHVAWRQIFQRPHILYLQLEKDFDCVLIEKVHYKNYSLPKQKINPQKKVSIFQLPRDGEIKIIRKICDFYNKIIIKRHTKKDILWLCHPEQYRYVPKNYTGKIVYDCMDNYASLGASTSREDVKRYEGRLIDRSDLILASSQRLWEMINRPEKTLLVRNGFLSTDKPLPVKGGVKKDEYTIAYFGTVSSWFDFELLKTTRACDTKINYRIIGPAEESLKSKWESEDIAFTGAVEHSLLPDKIEDCDALIMPFVVNHIILAVDPVKLYEYINFGKCIISVWYKEIDRFSPYVYFYKNEKEYIELIKELSENGFKPKYTDSERKAFLKENSWDDRYSLIKNGIDRLFE